MNTREYFSQLGRLKTQIAAREDELAFLRALEAETESAKELSRELSRELDAMIALRRQAAAAIDGLSNANERTVMQLRYINNWSWGRIAAEMHADKRTAQRWLKSALEHAETPEKPVTLRRREFPS